MNRLKPYKVRPAGDGAPDRWETGTKNHEGLAGVAAAIEYLAELGNKVAGEPLPSRRAALLTAMRAIQEYERGLAEQLITGLLKIPGLTFYGITDPQRFASRTPTVAVRIEGHTPRELAEFLGQRGIFTWDGNYYAINLTERLGVEQDGGMLRIGLVHYNTAAEVDQLLAALNEIARRA
jgi:selenocysteine lyase/cysteine desulfurase